MSATTWRDVALTAVLTWAALVVLHPSAAFQGKIYTSDDARASAAFTEVGRAAQREGETPLWNPYVFTGMPAFGSLAYTSDAYPLRKPLHWITWTFGLPPLTWLLFHLFVAGFTTALYLRWRGASLAAAIIAAVLIVSLPKLTAWSAYGHGTKVGTLAWLPLAMWSTEAFLRSGGWPWAFGLSVAVALQLLRAHVQIAYYSVMLLAIGTLFLVVPWLRDPARRRTTLIRLGVLGGAGLLALGAALVLYLPVLEYQGQSIRGAGSATGGASYDYATGWSLPWSELDTFWWPTAVGYGKGSYVGGMPFTDYPNYVGGLLMGLAAVGLALRRSRWKWALLFVAGLATLLALGKHGPLYQLFYDLVPGFKKFRVPVMVLILQEFAIILLAVTGLDDLLARLRSSDRPRWLGLPALFALGGVGLVLAFMGSAGAESLRNQSIDAWRAMSAARLAQPGGGLPAQAFTAAADLATADALRLGLILVGAAAALILVLRGRIPGWVAAAAIGTFLFFDYWSVNQPLLHPEAHLERLVRRGEEVALVPETALIREHAVVREFVGGNDVTRFLKSREERPRVWPWPGGPWASTNELAAQRIVSLGGYHAAKLKVYEDIRARLYNARPPEVRLANLLAANYVAVYQNEFSAASLDQLEAMGLRLGRSPLFRSELGTVYENLSARPRAWVVDSFELERPGEDTTANVPEVTVLDRVLGLDLARRAILSGRPDPAPQAGAHTGSIQIVEEGYTWVTMHADLPADGVVVVADIFYPGWGVSIDGEPARLLRANHALRGVAVPQGQHRLEFRFSARSYRTGRAVSRASGAVIVLGLFGSLWGDWRRRRSV